MFVFEIEIYAQVTKDKCSPLCSPKIENFKKRFVKMYLLLAVLGLHCCVWTFSSCGEWALFSSCGVWASHYGGFSHCKTQSLEHAGCSSCSLWTLELGLSSCGVWA